MEYLIVGAGISGLYIAYSLHKKFGVSNIMVIEKNKHLGGRIMTKYFSDGSFIEMGAGGIIDSQENVNALVKELGISVTYHKGESKKAYADLSKKMIDNPDMPFVYQIDNLIYEVKTDFFQIMDELYQKLSDPSFYQEAINYNICYLIEKYYGFSKAQTMMMMHGYHGDFYNYNAVDALKMFHTSFSKDASFTSLPNGMHSIIERLAEYLRKNDIIIQLDTKCVDISKKNGQYVCHLKNGGTIQARNIVLAIPKKNLLQIKYLKPVYWKFESVINKPLIRIYLFFPLENGKVWFDFMEGTITNNTILQQIIPVDKKRGLMMIYCDDMNANLLGGLHRKGVLLKEVYENLIKIFSHIKIPLPMEYYVNYCADAIHQWKPTYHSQEMYKEIRQPLSGENIYIVGEAFSLHQQWLEGAVKSVNDLMVYLNGKHI